LTIKKKFKRMETPCAGYCDICQEHKMLEYNVYIFSLSDDLIQILSGRPKVSSGRACKDCAVREMI